MNPHASQTSHQPRLDWPAFEQAAPAVLAALGALGKAVDDSGLEKTLTELIKVRASQLNGCAFCLQFHLNLARRLGVGTAKLDLLPVWREVAVYSPRERAALAWTEALTLMAGSPVPEGLYTGLLAEFKPSEAAFLTSAIGAINAWNRIAGALQFKPPIPSAAQESA